MLAEFEDIVATCQGEPWMIRSLQMQSSVISLSGWSRAVLNS